MLRWYMSGLFWLKPRPHRSHRYGFSPVWMRTCCVRWSFLRNCLVQKGQQWCFGADGSPPPRPRREMGVPITHAVTTPSVGRSLTSQPWERESPPSLYRTVSEDQNALSSN